MQNNYLITIISSVNQGGEKSTVEISTFGDVVFTESGFRIRYEETDRELAGCITSVELKSENRVEVSRTGMFSTLLTVETGKRHICRYETPFGELNMGICSKGIRSEANGQNGRLFFSYSIDFNSELVSENEMTISFKEA